MPARALTIENSEDQGLSAFKITTGNAVFFIQKENGGISSLLDVDGNDWVSYQPGGGAAGEYRGIPNALFPENISHPGRKTASCTQTAGNDKSVEITCNANNGCCTFIWTINDYYATIAFTKMNTHNYWFLYEGTPGGAVEGSDVWITSDGSSGSCNNEKSGDIPAPEWIAFADPNKGRSILLTHREDDTLPDKYYLMDPMTVFGFGRDGMNMYLSGQNTFNVALVEETEYSAIKPIAESIMADDLTGIKARVQNKSRKNARPVVVERTTDGRLCIRMKDAAAHTVYLYTLSGRIAASFSGNSDTRRILPAGVGPGAYLIRYTSGVRTYTGNLVIE